MNPSQINPEHRVHFNLAKNQFFEKKSIDEKACNLIVTGDKAVEKTTDSSSTTQTPREKRLDMQALAFVRNDLLDTIPALHNRQKIRIKDRGFEAKSRTHALISITSRIGGAQSKETVRSVLQRLEWASNLPVDGKNPQSVVNKLDELLNNEWFVKTIAHDRSGSLKNHVLNILANETLQMPGTRADSILAKLNPKTSMDEKKQALNLKMDAAIPKKPDPSSPFRNVFGSQFIDRKSNETREAVLAKIHAGLQQHPYVIAKLGDKLYFYADTKDIQGGRHKVGPLEMVSDDFKEMTPEQIKDYYDNWMKEYNLTKWEIDPSIPFRNVFGSQFIEHDKRANETNQEIRKKIHEGLQQHPYVIAKLGDNLYFYADAKNVHGVRLKIGPEELKNDDFKKMTPEQIKEIFDNWLKEHNLTKWDR